ncbi:MAG: hypothetical protein P4M13_00415 [Alphaproteobacteria bacterium]|nr:hypothetical protein [Alphaproteobacteria bacterium]
MKKAVRVFISILKIYAYFVATIVTAYYVYAFAINTANRQDGSDVLAAKPVIYLYPQKEQETFIRLDYHGKLTTSFPAYDDGLKGWRVLAYPDGHVVNLADNETYNYLFWEGKPEKADYDFSTGFVVAGKDTASFLRKTLEEFGLTPKEYNEFIVYWLPKMENNAYNLIHFADKEYTKNAPLNIEPKPDSLLRVFMVYKPIDKRLDIKPQTIAPFVRKGFSVVEWGGSEVE